MSHESINRKGFMVILSKIWSTWTSEETIIKAAKRVRISANGLCVDWMQQSKFQSAEAILDTGEAGPSTRAPIINNTAVLRRNSAKYWKEVALEAQARLEQQSVGSVDLVEAGILTNKKIIKPKQSGKNMRFTQVRGSLTKQDMLKQVSEFKEKKEVDEKKKNERKEKVEDTKRNFMKCMDDCTCKEKVCVASGLKLCPSCGDVTRSCCSKARCRTADNSRPEWIVPHFDRTRSWSKKILIRDTDEDDESEECADPDSDVEITDLENEEDGIVLENDDYSFEENCDVMQAGHVSVLENDEDRIVMENDDNNSFDENCDFTKAGHSIPVSEIDEDRIVEVSAVGKVQEW